MNPDDLIARILASLSALPQHERSDATCSLISAVIRELPRDRVMQIRADIVSELDPAIPIVATVLNLIDGQLALRDMGLNDK